MLEKDNIESLWFGVNYSEIRDFYEVIDGNIDPTYIPFKKAEDINNEYIRIFENWQEKVLKEISKEKIIPVIDFYKKVYQEGVVQKANCSFFNRHIEKLDKNRYKELQLKLKELRNLSFMIIKDKSVKKQILNLKEEIIEIEKLLFTDVLNWYSIKNEKQLPYDVIKEWKDYSLLNFVFYVEKLDKKNIDSYISSKIISKIGSPGVVFYRARDNIKEKQKVVKKRNLEYHENITKMTEIKSSGVNEVEDDKPKVESISSSSGDRSYYDPFDNTYYIDSNYWDNLGEVNDNDEELKGKNK